MSCSRRNTARRHYLGKSGGSWEVYFTTWRGARNAGWRRMAAVAEKAAIAFLGIRGLGSFYYLAYALLGQAEFEQAQTL